MATTFTQVQQLGGWTYDSYQRAVACRMLVDDDGDTIPIAELGLRRVCAMYVLASSITSRTPRLLGRTVQSPYDVNAEYSFTLIGPDGAPYLRVYDNGNPVTNVNEAFDVIFVGEV